MALLRRIVSALAAGSILFVYSERIFWSRFNPGDTLLIMLLTWLAYSVLGYIFLALVGIFRVRRLEALFLCGAVFGWLGEGVLVQTMYDSFPLNISWTGLAWHALISVGVGWYLVRRTLLKNKPVQVAGLAAAIGAGWGLWALWWGSEGGGPIPFSAFAVHTLVSSATAIAGYWVYQWVQPDSFRPSRVEQVLLVLAPALLFALGVIPVQPLAVAILLPLLAVVLFALDRNRRQETGPDLFAELSGQAGWPSYLALLAMPAAAITVYTTRLAVAGPLPTNWLFVAVTVPAGFILLGLSLYRLVWRRKGQGQGAIA